MIPGLLFVFAAIFSVVPWLVKAVGRKALATCLILGIGTSIIGAVFSLPFFPWTDLVVLLIALSGGVLAGRILPPRARPIAIVLLVFSILDTIQVLLTSGSSPPNGTSSSSSPLLYANFLIPPPIGGFNLGIADILFIAMIGEHWRRRASISLAVLPGLVGFALADLFVAVTSYGDLPLIPFLAIGWLISEGLRQTLPVLRYRMPA